MRVVSKLSHTCCQVLTFPSGSGMFRWGSLKAEVVTEDNGSVTKKKKKKKGTITKDSSVDMVESPVVESPVSNLSRVPSTDRPRPVMS